MISYGQKQSNVWYFGTGVGLDFNNNECSPTVLSDGAMHAFEGCTTIADENSGELLFYTNSDTVWNRNHQSMVSSSLVASGSSITQSVIIKKPFSDSLYYIVTADIQGLGIGLRFHCVDMNLNNGLGGIAYRDSILYPLNAAEKLTAVRHANGVDVWVIGHAYGSNNFLAFLLTSSGFNTVPVISAIGKTYQGSGGFTADAIGEMKASPDGAKLAVVTLHHPDIELFNFDKSTGQLSGLITLPEIGGYNGLEYSISGLYGVSFSPDNTKLYACSFAESSLNLTGKIIQYTITSGNTAIINDSRVNIVNSTTTGYPSMKIGPDGKIYVSRDFNNPGGDYLGVINHPNLTGFACGYVDTAIYLNGGFCSWGLNNLMEYGEYCTSLELNENENLETLLIYPNPANEEFYIDYHNLTVDETELIIYDATGAVIRKISTNADGHIAMERNELIEGLYFVQLLQSGRPMAIGKFIFE